MDSEGVHAFPGLPMLATGLRLETPDLALRQFVEADIAAPAAKYAGPETMRYRGDGRTFSRRPCAIGVTAARSIAASIRAAEKIGQRHQGSLELFEKEAPIHAIP